MATFTCAGKDYPVPEMNFLAVERAWPFVKEATEQFDPMKGSSAAIGVIAAAMIEAEDFSHEEWGIDPSVGVDLAFAQLMHTMKKRLKAVEIGNVKSTMLEILKEGGLQVDEGELLSALEALAKGELLTETALNTSPSSLPPE